MKGKGFAAIGGLVCLCLTMTATEARADVNNPTIQERDPLARVWPNGYEADEISLNGEWNIKVIKGVDDELGVPPTDETWTTIPVPGCWEIYGLAEPTYDKSDYLTGFYRHEFSVPDEWRGQRVALRLDGVLYAYYLWINGEYVGQWKSAYNTALYDITPYLRKKGPQEIAMRVITRYAGVDFDFFDDWTPSGIFRDVKLFPVPETHVADYEVQTLGLDGQEAQMSFAFEVENPGKTTSITADILSPKGSVVASFDLDLSQGKALKELSIPDPEPWTAETPSLYIIRYSLKQKGKTLQTFSDKFGIRKLTIDGNILKLNGRPIKLRGVTCHSTDYHTGKVISDSLTLLDMRLMKQASINYIRTSHYPREPRFYELADSMGFYVIDETPFGRGEKNLSNPAYYPQLRQRAQATIRRDKNHPSVLIWSLGNENPLTAPCQWLGSYVKDTLLTDKPICYPQVGSYFRKFDYDFPKVADIYAPHYPTTSQIADFYQRADRPVIFTEYCHTLGISLEDHDRQWEIIERTPCIAGGSVWEWVDQAMPFTEPKDELYGYEERVYTSPEGGFMMNGNKGTDGIMYADRTPLPNYYELQHNYAQAAILDDTLFTSGNEIALRVRNRYDFIDLEGNVEFNYALTSDRDTLARGSFTAACPPRQETTCRLSLPAGIGPKDALCLLHIETIKKGTGLMGRHTIRINPTSLTDRLINNVGVDRVSTRVGAPHEEPAPAIAPASFKAMLRDSLLVRAGRKATMCERIKVGDQRIEHYLIAPIASETPITAVGAPHEEPAPATLLTAKTDKGDISLELDIKEVATGLSRITFILTPDTTSDAFLSELGLALPLRENIDRVRWIGQGPLPTYPGRYQAGRYGLHALQAGDLYFEGNRQGVDAALATDEEGNGLLIFCDNGNINFEQTDQGLVLSVNAAVSGQGPKFSKTAFPVMAKSVGSVSASFYACPISALDAPDIIGRLFGSAADVPEPFRPFLTQYDTYLMRYDNIKR